MSIDPEEYGTFKGETRAQLKEAGEDIKKIFTLIEEILLKVEAGNDKFLEALREHMKNEEAAMKEQAKVDALRVKAAEELANKVGHMSGIIEGSQPALALLEKVIIILEFLTWKNMLYIAALVFLVLGILVPVSQNMFPPESVPGQIIDALTYGPHLIKEFT